MYAIQGFLFNHEGTRRGEEFVTRKITKSIGRINNSIKKNESFKPLELGNVYAKRDWSDAEDFIDGIWRMLNQELYNDNYSGNPEEYVFSSNETHSIKEFVELSFKCVNINGYWKNKIDDNPINEKFYFINNNNEEIILVEINTSFYRPLEVELLFGDSSRVRKELKWTPRVSFLQLIEKMVKNDLFN